MKFSNNVPNKAINSDPKKLRCTPLFGSSYGRRYFSKRELSMIQNEKDFFDWIDGQLNEEIPGHIVAFNINIYESPFNIELIGSSEFDLDDEDWACNEDWIPRNRSISVSTAIFGNSWEEAQGNILEMAKQYFQSNYKNSYKLKAAKAFAVGFVDGDLSYVQ